uniref:Centromere protein Cenp-F N-terminal domain-containing protein n=1 Tax=Labrus bergylta TaxID=56723 RepID=A0A3Q3EED8_9LABR
MSWAVEEWKDGLPGKALQKIQEMEVQLDKLKKERSQKQFQMDSLEAALQKQKQKVGVYLSRIFNDSDKQTCIYSLGEKPHVGKTSCRNPPVNHLFVFFPSRTMNAAKPLL